MPTVWVKKKTGQKTTFTSTAGTTVSIMEGGVGFDIQIKGAYSLLAPGPFGPSSTALAFLANFIEERLRAGDMVI